LDGLASGEDVGPFFGYGGPELDAWIQAHLDQPQLIVLGRITFEALAAISAARTDPISSKMNALPKVVLSRTLEEPLAWANTRLLSGDLGEIVRVLKQESGAPLRTMGSVSLVKSLMRLGLVDRLRLMVFPLTLGSAGRDPLFNGFAPARFALERSEVLDDRLVLLEYRTLKAGAR
jgi:dihydrofolate reductase